MNDFNINFNRVIVFVLLSSLGFISTDIYITALPLIAEDFDTLDLFVQYTITVYFIGLAITQILYAILAERYGINALIYTGLVIYIFSCFFCFFSSTVEQLIIARFIQAMGACSGMVLGRAIITTIYNHTQSAKVFNMVYPFVGMSPAIIPIFGGEVTKFLNWRTNFLILGALGIVTLLMYVFHIPKLKKMKHQHLTGIMQTNLYLQVLANPIFLFSTGLVCLADGAYFSYVLKAPFIFFDYGYSVNTMSIFFLITATSYFIGNYVCRLLLDKYTIIYVLNIGIITFFISAFFLFLGKIVFEIDGVSIYIISLSSLTFSNGFIISLGTTISMNISQKSKNISSGILGFLQFMGVSLTMLIANNLPYYYLPMLLFSLSLLMLCCNYYLNKKFLDRHMV